MEDPRIEPSCSGIKVVKLAGIPGGGLLIVLAEPLGCPTCGRAGAEWMVPIDGDGHPVMKHHRPDPGE